ncbi:carbon-nitrogen hydrolase family protein [Ihubacter massiliensis]|uniref:Carbon-nitrogen hydrolase family protein n=1 Tax=Hominibacterium faecale TaxID=2839743 RepID=A0A9J6QMV8_9FIRM|nr:MULTISPECIES: carbon-nitrogen hydrolase family protein [Eubacteriales Family XIII. Incertae Sedis]MCI7304419.1 carbon-nitrogen hydrolase family protein [Clostridia bacterium]MDE8733795.1 carbon-nitrogen hydrolase family protein [Eubacteriales bacterium DFI.9.88]MDY3011132.1 carbon-nitrogen hydrolase family protein [Clostridiales Family XIII bacterium]MCO7123834.1 carbon-nitrogen hydrolase family protein [Ihubacter massiliensis]MCU7378760.1 carbon-nitrogen hydrolase family protein [Hominibac
MKIRVACSQIDCVLGDKEANFKKMEESVKTIKSDDPTVELIVFPELALNGYECPELFEDMAEVCPGGAYIRKIGRIAQIWDVHIAFGFIEREDREYSMQLYNTALLLDNKGAIIGTYRKSHLVEGFEADNFTKGGQYPVFDTRWGKVGMAICWDAAFPETVKLLALKGAELILVLAAWEKPHAFDWDLTLAARAFDNVACIAACNRAGTDRTLSYLGKSKLVAPGGRVLKECGDEECTIIGTLNLDEVKKMRRGYYDLIRNASFYEVI